LIGPLADAAKDSPSAGAAGVMLRLSVWLTSAAERCEIPVTQKQSRQPGSAQMPGSWFSASGSDAGLGPRILRLRLLALVSRPKAPPLMLGVAVAAALLVIQTLIVCSLNMATNSTGHFGTLYLVGVLVVSTVWGFGLAATMSVASAIAFAYFRLWPATNFSVAESQNWLVIGVFLIVALAANALAGLARVGERFFVLSPDLLCISGPESVVRINPAFGQILGYSIDDLAARPYLDLVVSEDRDRVRGLLEQLPGHAGPVRFEDRVICRDGSQRWVEWSVVWHRGLFYAVGRDATERRREQGELHQAQVVAEARRDKLKELAEQQAALRRVATLVARGASSSEVFSTVADEMAGCLGVRNASVNRFDGDQVVVLALSHLDEEMANKPVVGERHTLEGDNIATRVIQAGRPARLEGLDVERAPGSIAARLRDMGLRCTVAVPIVVEGHVWGMAAVGSSALEPLPPDTEARVGDFADLVATSIANAATRSELQSRRDELRVLADQQAALRRVATLVARGVTPSEVFCAVAEEMARCLHVRHATVSQFSADDTLIPLAIFHGAGLQQPPEGLRLALDGDNVATRVFQTSAAARMDSHDDAAGTHAARIRELGIRSAVGVPIIVDGRRWGAAIVGSWAPEPLPPDTEERIGDFADLVATAIANAATRTELVASRARIVAAADDARRRLERDLHDGAQQRLVALGLQTRLAEASVPPQLDGLKSQLSRVVSGLIDVSTDLREISRGIHPAILSEGGLGPALNTLARRSTVPVALDLAIDQRLPDAVEIGAYYIVAEALTNAAKYARASQVELSAGFGDDNLNLSIRDDGIGGADVSKGSGLIGLKDRAEALGGSMTIASSAGNGTSLYVTIPLERE
jgi:PAS domain S-box-containing protein